MKTASGLGEGIEHMVVVAAAPAATGGSAPDKANKVVCACEGRGQSWCL